MEKIRYLADKTSHGNITRACVHPIWTLARKQAATIDFDPTPVLPEARALEIIRHQRLDMAEQQAFGNLINAFVIGGKTTSSIAEKFADHAARAAQKYADNKGESLLSDKAKKSRDRLIFLMPASKS